MNKAERLISQIQKLKTNQAERQKLKEKQKAKGDS